MAKSKYYQRKDGLFESIRTINGKRVAFRGHSCREVDRKILEYKEKLEFGRTVKEVAEQWQKEREPHLSESSRIAYKAPVKDLLDYIGEKPVKDIKPIQLERYMLQLKGKGYRLGAVKLRLTVCKQIFRFAVIQGDIDISPAAEIHLPGKLDRQKRGSLTAQQIVQVAKYRGPGYLLGIALLFTGCRRGELMGLRYEDIDRKNKTISIQRKVSYATGKPVLEDHTKTEAGMRTIPLLKPLEDVLPVGRIGPIFHEDDGNLMKAYTIEKTWADFLNGCGLPDNITPHWMRHTFATICYDAGLDPKSTAAMMGHASDKITLEIYTHLSKSREQVNADKLAEYLEKETAAE